MTFHYHWPKIKRVSGGKVQTIRIIFESMMNYPRKAVGRLSYDEMDFTGDSYLINPEGLLEAFQQANQIDAANYLMLASYRNYAQYQVTGDATLPLKHINIPTDRLKLNSLVEIRDNEIHFLLEKNNYGT